MYFITREGQGRDAQGGGSSFFKLSGELAHAGLIHTVFPMCAWTTSVGIVLNRSDEISTTSILQSLQSIFFAASRCSIRATSFFFMKWGIKAARIETDRLTHELPKDVWVKKMMPLSIQDDEIQTADAFVSVILKG